MPRAEAPVAPVRPVAPASARRRPASGWWAPALVVVGYLLVRGIALWTIVPPWQGPDEPGHAEYAILLGRERRLPRRPDANLEPAILDSMARHEFYAHLDIAPPARPPVAFAEVARLGGDPTQLTSETPLGYLPHALAAALAPADGGIDTVLAAMRLASLVLVLLVVLVAGAAAWWTLGRGPAVPMAALVAAAPMLGFGGAVVNNDLTAAVLAGGWFALLARAARRGVAPADLALLGLVAVLASAAKRTGLYLVPLWILVTATVVWSHRRGAGATSMSGAAVVRSRRRRWALVGLALAVVVAAWWPLSGRAAGWTEVGPGAGVERSRLAARGGRWGLRVADRTTAAWQYVAQTVRLDPATKGVDDGAPTGVTDRGGGGGGTPRGTRREMPGSVSATAHGGGSSGGAGPEVRATVWLRGEGAGERAEVVVSDDAGTWLGRLVDLTGEWRRAEVTGTLAPGATRVRLALVPGGASAAAVGALQADDAALMVAGRPVLRNGGAEAPRRLGNEVGRAVVDYSDLDRIVGSIPGAVADLSRTAARTWRALAFLYRSFWGGFGWLTIWPGRGYDLPAGAITLFAVVGWALALLAPARLGRDPVAAGLLRWCAVAASLAVAAAASGSMAGWGPDSLPQGRYLLAALVPLALPAVALAERLRPRGGPWLLALAAVALDAALIVREAAPGFGLPR